MKSGGASAGSTTVSDFEASKVPASLLSEVPNNLMGEDRLSAALAPFGVAELSRPAGPLPLAVDKGVVPKASREDFVDLDCDAFKSLRRAS